MPDRIEFDPAVENAVRTAAEYARYLGHESVDTVHLLLGLLGAGRDLFHGIPNGTIREQILAKVERSTPIEPNRELPFTPAAVRALRLPVPGSEMSASGFVRTEDVLRAILDEPGSFAATVLRSSGVSYD